MTHYRLPETNACVEYDKETKGLYVAMQSPIIRKGQNLRDRIVVRTVNVHGSPLVNLDYNEDDNLVGVEVLLP